MPTDVFYRMPLGYGPFPGPRQTATGDPVLGWNDVKTVTSSIVFRAPKEQLASFLPRPCFTIDSPTDDRLSLASISFTRLENLPWLAGRGYNHCGLYIHNVTCTGRDESVHGKYLSLLFENRADPITSGREELGYAKVYASLDEHEDENTNWAVKMGWEGTEFGHMQLDGLVEGTVGPAAGDDDIFKAQDVLHYKYIPRTGSPGIADAEYPTVSPIPAGSGAKVEKVFSATKASVGFKGYGFTELPTLHHITEKLAGIEIVEVVGARMVVGMGAADFRAQRAITI